MEAVWPNPFEQIAQSGLPNYGGLQDLSTTDPSPKDYHSQYPASSRRGSMDSVMSSISPTSNQPSITIEQATFLERQFSTCSKPNVKRRREIADATGLPIQRVVLWFQYRRARAKQQKKHEELQTKRVLESAGRRRASLSRTRSFVTTGDTSMLGTPPFRRSNSAAAALNASSSRQYSSPSEASYASLARAFAVAVAANAAQSAYKPKLDSPYADAFNRPTYTPGLDGMQSPPLVSAFSDYGSSQCSPTAYTPLSTTEDPFEYDQHALPNSRRQSHDIDSYFQLAPAQPDYEAFAAGIEMNSHSFVLPAFPPKSLVERRPRAFGAQVQRDATYERITQPNWEQPSQQSPASDVPSYSNPEAGGLAARRRRRRPIPKPIRSYSYMGKGTTSQQMVKTDQALCAAPLRRTYSADTSVIPRRSSDSGHLGCTDYSPLDIPDSAVTARPHVFQPDVSKLSNDLLELFPPVEAPLTPISPADKPLPDSQVESRSEAAQLCGSPSVHLAKFFHGIEDEI